MKQIKLSRANYRKVMRAIDTAELICESLVFVAVMAFIIIGLSLLLPII